MSEQEKSEVRSKLFGKEGGGVQAESFSNDMKETASNSMAKALYKVFVEKTNEFVDPNQLKSQLEEASNSETTEGRKYKVRVSDKQSGVSYVRYATRKKINQLREKGLDVEMTEYGTPYEGERTKGEKTSEVLSKRGKKDYDGDGKVESGAKEHAGAVHNAIQRKKGGVPDGKDTSSVKESFLGEVSRMANLPQTDAPAIADPNMNIDQIDLLPTNKRNKVTVNPSNTVLAHTELSGEIILETGYSKFLEMLQEKKMTKSMKKKEKKLKSKYDDSGMKASMQKQYGEKEGKKVYFATIRKQAVKEESECGSDDESKDDPRSIKTKVNLVKNKLRSMGLKMSYEPEGEVIDERTRYAKETGKDPQTGKPSVKGGSLGGNDINSRVMRNVSANIRKTGGLVSSRGKAIQPQGKKKVRGQKQVPMFTPVSRIKRDLSLKREPNPDIGSRFD
jgi:hypothetical protein